MYRRRSEEAVEAVISAGDIQRAEYWHVLRTPPAREIDAGLVLHDLGFLVYCPMQTAWKRAGRNGGLRIRQRPAGMPAFVRYIFVGFTRGDPDWRALFDTGYIRGVVAVDGRPYRVAPKEVARVALAQRAGAFDDAGARDSGPTVEVGARVRVDDGPLRGLYFRVETIRDGSVGVLAAMLGQLNYVELKLDAVTKAA